MTETVDPFVAKVESGLRAALSLADKLLGFEVSWPQEPLAPALLPAPLRLVVGLSGGPDSTALLLALASLRAAMPLSLSACHVNHHLRGAESDRDEAFCVELCAEQSVPLLVRHLRFGGGASPGRVSEAASREARLGILREAARNQESSWIVLAHTLDDQVETVLFRLFRGTGLAGLIGMEKARRLDARLAILRPVLSVYRLECLDFLERGGVKAVHDSSNDRLDYTRNYIRHRILPLVSDRFPGFEARLEQLRQIVAEEDGLLNLMAEETLFELECSDNRGPGYWSLSRFRMLPKPLQGRVLARSLQLRAIAVTFQRVEAILETIGRGSALSLNSRWDIRVDGQALCWLDKSVQDQERSPPQSLEQTLQIPGVNLIAALGKALKIEVWTENRQSGQLFTFPAAFSDEALVDLKGASFPLVLRNRRPGDVIRPFGMDQLVKLKKYLHNHKPEGTRGDSRQSLLVIADQKEILWVPGVGLSNRVRVTGAPSHRLQWVELAPDETNLC